MPDTEEGFLATVTDVGNKHPQLSLCLTSPNRGRGHSVDRTPWVGTRSRITFSKAHREPGLHSDEIIIIIINNNDLSLWPPEGCVDFISEVGFQRDKVL